MEDVLGELFINSISKEGSGAIEKMNQGLRAWVETEIIERSILRKVLKVSNERPVPVTGGLGYPFAKLSPNVNGVMVTGEFPSIRSTIVRQEVVPCVLMKLINAHAADLDELRAVADMKEWVRKVVTDEIEYKENVLLLTALHGADGSATDITTTDGNFRPEAMPSIKDLITNQNLEPATMIVKRSLYNDISGWVNAVVSDSTLDQIKSKADAISSYAGIDIIPVQDRIFTASGTSAEGFVLADKQYLGWVLEGTPLSVTVERKENMSMLFNGGESLGLSIINDDAVQAFTISAAA